MKILSAIHLVDLRTFQWCLQRKHRQLFVQLSRWVSKSADGYLYAIIAAGFAVLQHWLLVKLLFVAVCIERGLYFILKNQLRRNRPQQTIPGYRSVIQPSDQFSFPSGHTSAAFLMMGILSAFYPVLAIPLLLWATWVGISRVMLGVHFPTDSVAGALLGYLISKCCLRFFVGA
jgi:undecaprenyl-diphosphatase